MEDKALTKGLVVFRGRQMKRHYSEGEAFLRFEVMRKCGKMIMVQCGCCC